MVIGGHIDSWDVGQGAHDDGGGCVAAMEALSVLRRMGLRPRRTIRVVLWVNEENGGAGAKTYAATHRGELPRHVAAIESDSGVYRPVGLNLEHADPAAQARAAARLRDLLTLTEPLGMTRLEPGFSGSDVRPMKDSGVPLLGLRVHNEHYFDIHHTAADTLDKVNPAELTDVVASFAVLAYVLADMPGRLDAPVQPGGDTP